MAYLHIDLQKHQAFQKILLSPPFDWFTFLVTILKTYFLLIRTKLFFVTRYPKTLDPNNRGIKLECRHLCSMRFISQCYEYVFIQIDMFYVLHPLLLNLIYIVSVSTYICVTALFY